MKKTLLIILFLIVSLGSFAQFGEFVVIGNNTGFKASTKANAKAIFRGKYSSWKNGESVTIVLPSTKSDNVVSVASQVYGLTVKGMQKYWLEQVFQGRSNAPVFFETDEEIINYVKRNPGAVGIVRSSRSVPQSLVIQITE
jgi:ABC-type phosphate transport system substrate-binding protein